MVLLTLKRQLGIWALLGALLWSVTALGAAASLFSVHIGVFNSQDTARAFYEALPDSVSNTIKTENLWLDVVHTPKGFKQYDINIRNLTKPQAQALCQVIKDRNFQCLLSQRQPLIVNQPPARTAKITKKARPAALTPARKPSMSPSYQIENFHTLTNQQIEEQFQKQDKARYDQLVSELAQSIKRVGTRAEDGDAAAALSDEMMMIGQKLFDHGNQMYVDTVFGGSPSLAPEDKTLLGHVKNNLKKQAQVSLTLLVKKSLSNLAKGKETGDISHHLDEFVLASIRGTIDASIAKAKGSDLFVLRTLEVQYKLGSLEDSYLSLLATQPIYQSHNLAHNVFLQGGLTVNEQSVDIDDDTKRHTINMGLAYRHLTKSDQTLIGANVFVDHQFPFDHTRISIGGDIRMDNLKLSGNYYIPVTDFKQTRIDNDGSIYEERALEGYDLELGYDVPEFPRLTLFGKMYKYYRDQSNQEDLKGLSLSAEYDMNDRLQIRGSLIEENGGRDGAEVMLTYSIPLYDAAKPNRIRKKMASGKRGSMREHIFDKVHRENIMRLEERKITRDILTA